MAHLVQLDVVDSPAVWHDLGFHVVDDACVVGTVRINLLSTGDGKGPGIERWILSGLPSLPVSVDGLPTTAGDDPDIAAPGPSHPNAVAAIDHLVVSTPDIDRTTAAIAATGLDLRRTRNAETYGRTMRQSFFKLDDVVLEVIGPAEPAGTGPARFLGLALTSTDLDATVHYLGDRLHPPKPAVQPGRFIATLDRSAGTRVAMAFMSPEPVRHGSA